MTDEEIYYEIQTLHDDNETWGCYIHKHCDLEQWKRVSLDWLKTECDLTSPEKYQEFKIGYHKMIPTKERFFYTMYFSKEKMRGSKPCMETIFN